MSFGSCDVFPLEAVLAYVEVKSKLESVTIIRNLLKQSHRLRKLQTKFYRVPKKDTYTKTALVAGGRLISVRSFVFALDANDALGDHLKIKLKIEKEIRKTKGFLTGMYVQGKGYFQSHPAETADDPLIGTIDAFDAQNALLTFKLSLLSALSRFPRIATKCKRKCERNFMAKRPDLLHKRGRVRYYRPAHEKTFRL